MNKIEQSEGKTNLQASEDSKDGPELKIGIIGTDTSHVPAFTKLLNDPAQEYHVSGGRVVMAFPGGSPDFELSRDRVQGFADEIRDGFGVELLDSSTAVAERCDAILLTSVDGRVHREQVRQIITFQRPIFIDKPFATSTEDAYAIAQMAAEQGVTIMSCSALRYAQPLVDALDKVSGDDIFGADVYGPMPIQHMQPGLFWYGIHTVEILYAALGSGCRHVMAASNEEDDVITGVWQDGRIGTIRGNRRGNNEFGALLHTSATTKFVNAYPHPKPSYAGLLERVMPFFRGGQPDVEIDETIEIVRFIEAANQSRMNGERVLL